MKDILLREVACIIKRAAKRNILLIFIAMIITLKVDNKKHRRRCLESYAMRFYMTGFVVLVNITTFNLFLI